MHKAIIRDQGAADGEYLVTVFFMVATCDNNVVIG